jgi:hypothetical protein
MAHADAEEKLPESPVGPLRVGLLVDSMIQPAWVERALRDVRDSGAGEFCLVVVNATPAAVPGSRFSSWWRNRRQLLFAAYQRLDRRQRADPDPFALVDVAPMLGSVERLDVLPTMGRATDEFTETDLDAIRGARLDVLVRIGFRILKGGILRAAKHGVWSYHHGDHTRFRGGPPCFWEVIEREPVTGTILQRLTDALDDGEVLYRSWGATNIYSVVRSRKEVYWKSAAFLGRAMRRVQHGLLPDGRAVPPSSYGHRLYVVPNNRQMAAGFSRLAARRLGAKWRSFRTKEQWFLAWRHRAGLPDDHREPDLAPYRFKPLFPPADRYWADPFPIRVKGANYVLFEDYRYGSSRGVISALEMGAGGPVGDSQVVLQCDYHLSYPFVFTWRGEHYMVPETVDVSRVEWYRAVRAPYEWTLENAVTHDLPLADCTLAEIDGRWWMFANGAQPGVSFWDELYLFHAPSPLGPWTPHRMNPVVSDVRTARPAGALFRRGAHWYRPSQDSSGGYGSATSIQRILRLDDRHYEEETVTRLVPGWQPGLHGVHTVNALAGLTVIDAKRRIPK